MSLQGRGAVVTGGGRGIGAVIARRLVEGGAGVVVTARTEEEIEAVAGELRDAGHRAEALACDVTDPEAVGEMACKAVGALGQVDVLVNNAGTASSAPLEKTAPEEWARVMSVNATGTFLCTRALIGEMAERGWGRVVNVASVAGLTGGRYISAYAASKHAVVGFTRSLAEEFGDSGITVNAVCPGYVDTPMTDRSVERIVEATGMDAADALEALLRTTSQRRLIRPEEVAHAVLALCGEEAAGINGQAIVVDGGGLRA